ncbi:hypothetical protein ACSSS7_007554 [Eimeria intestinalis]
MMIWWGFFLSPLSRGLLHAEGPPRGPPRREPSSGPSHTEGYMTAKELQRQQRWAARAAATAAAATAAAATAASATPAGSKQSSNDENVWRVKKKRSLVEVDSRKCLPLPPFLCVCVSLKPLPYTTNEADRAAW